MFESADPEVLATFWDAMHALSTLTGRALGAALDLRRFHRLLDVGGGSAAFDIVLCQRHADLAATVYDLELVADIAHRSTRRQRRRDRPQALTRGPSLPPVSWHHQPRTLSPRPAIRHGRARP
jgi:3-hydroxy-5-methyl-1-naphthoate 3-O-methyltransferase